MYAGLETPCLQFHHVFRSAMIVKVNLNLEQEQKIQMQLKKNILTINNLISLGSMFKDILKTRTTMQ